MSFGEIAAYGVSAWDIKDGDRLRREMQRSTRFSSVKEMERWAKRYGIDASPMVYQWQKLATSEVA